MTKKKFLIASFSALIQYYDYHLFGFLAAQIAKNFFPTGTPSEILTKAYLIMLVAACAKPVASIILGRIGDLYGRNKTINIGILITAAASFAVGALPSFESIGIFAPLILLLARMCITSCASSGSDGVRLYIYEKISSKKKNFGTGLTTCSTIGGSLLASTSAWLFTLEILPSYFWRFSFFLGAIAGFVIVIVRKVINLDEDLLYQKEESYFQYKNMPLWQIIKQNAYLFLACTFLAGGIGSTYSFNFVFWVTYNIEILQSVNESVMQQYRSVGIILYMLFALLGGFVADMVTPRISASFAAISILIVTAVNIYLTQMGILFIPFYLLNSALLPFLTIPSLTLLKSSIPKVIRYRLFSFSHAIGAMLISAPTPYIVTTLYDKTKISWLPLLYFAIITLIMLIAINALFKLQKTTAQD